MLKFLCVASLAAFGAALTPMQKNFVGAENEVTAKIPGTLDISANTGSVLKGSYTLGNSNLKFDGDSRGLNMELLAGDNYYGFETKSGNDFQAQRTLPNGKWIVMHEGKNFLNTLQEGKKLDTYTTNTAPTQNNFRMLQDLEFRADAGETLVDDLGFTQLTDKEFGAMVANLAVKMGAAGLGGTTHDVAGAIVQMGSKLYNQDDIKAASSVTDEHVAHANSVFQATQKTSKVPTQLVDLQVETQLGLELGSGSCSTHPCGPPYSACGNPCFGRCGGGCTCWDWLCGDCCCHGGCHLHDVYCSCSPKNYAMCYIPTAVFIGWGYGGGCGCGTC